MLKNPASGTIILALLLFILWQLVDNSFLNNVPLETRHLLFMVVATVFALFVASLATSEINRQYRRLQELEKLRTDLTDMLVHDLRTPLTSVLGSLQTLKAGALGEMSAEMSEMVDLSLDGSEHLLRLVNDLLDISKIESGSMELAIQPANIRDLVDSAVQQVRTLAFEKNIDLQTQTVPESYQPECDEDLIRRVLVNLLGNAVKFTPTGGTVSILVSEDSKGYTIRVNDSGPGIPKEFHEKIFDKFQQMNLRHSGKGSSTGLGLTFCKLVVEAHDGRIWVESEPEHGSSFAFFLPKRRHLNANA